MMANLKAFTTRLMTQNNDIHLKNPLYAFIGILFEYNKYPFDSNKIVTDGRKWSPFSIIFSTIEFL